MRFAFVWACTGVISDSARWVYHGEFFERVIIGRFRIVVNT